ncbi:hypothetical protein B0H10DRAFT_2015213 [Mycena sp. CBHHK59/15]|nr:hypothetical protein B0H10DRAFT_2015213 [Mycena sp. CBHHK59/15]
MTTAAHSPDADSPPDKKRKKLPACDSCKSRRVWCHPQPNGNSCPRCRERGIACTTTPVTRGRPRKKRVASPDIALSQNSGSSPSAEITNSPLLASGSKTPYETALIPTYIGPLDPTASLDLSPELVHHLFECFAQLPHSTNPIYHGTTLRCALAAVAWSINLLPPQPRVLAHCVCALAASIAYHPEVLGPGVRPSSFFDRIVFMLGADLRAYGVRRAPVFRALHARALRLAFEAGVLVDASEDNAMSCVLLEQLDRQHEKSSRPWAGAYLSHARTLAASWNGVGEGNRPALWTGFLMSEALAALALRKPVLVTHNDQLLLTGAPPVSLEQLLDLVQLAVQQSTKRSTIDLSLVMRPFMFHSTRIAREMWENITGDYARRQPLSETAVMRIVAELTTLQRIRDLVSVEFEPVLQSERDADASANAIPSFFAPYVARHSQHMNVRACLHALTIGYTDLVLALHEEIAFRESCGHYTAHVADSARDARWERERLALLGRQVCELARRAAPSRLHLTHVQVDSLHRWARFCLEDGADPDGAIAETVTGALKLIGYSWDLSMSSALIARLEAHVAQRCAFVDHADSVDFDNLQDMGFMQVNGSGFLEDGSTPCESDMQMFLPPLDDNWMGMFTVGGDG